MTITEELDAVRAAVPGCLMVAYADLSSGLMLCVSSARRQKQEALEALCATASDLLDGAAASRAAETIGEAPAEAIDEAVSLAPGATLAFLRSAADPVEALCCIGTADMDVGALLTEARGAMGRIEGKP
jgi:hypothetical protein